MLADWFLELVGMTLFGGGIAIFYFAVRGWPSNPRMPGEVPRSAWVVAALGIVIALAGIALLLLAQSG